MSSYTPPIFTAILFILWWSKNIDFFNLAVLASIGARQNTHCPLVGRPGLEPGEVKLPVLQTGPLPATVYRPILSYFWRVILDSNQDVYKTADLQKSS